MSTTIITVGPDDTVEHALETLEKLDVRHLPVVDDGRLVGMISDRDLREYRLPVLEELDNPDMADDLLQTPVSELMTGHVLSVDAVDRVRTAVGIMLEHRVGALPVREIETGKLVGILSYVDVLRELETRL